MTSAAAIAAAFVIGGRPLRAQSVTPDRGAAALGSTLAGIGTTGRVLTVAAHPDDEDTPVIAWLAKGRHVETAYLSLTRGDGGQNLIGNELGEALGAIRTQELLSARRIDGGRQYFTRAYDFGFSKNAEETYTHWPKDSILGDVVRVVRAFRPHVMVAFFSGTTRDGHGHHQVSGLLAREAYDLAADTVRFPVKGFGLPWTPQKFYRSARQAPDSATLRVNVGEYDALLG
ncbi:MAG: PIG-L family deacetylase, partial [Gemmatimonadota bacterium]|nr:PIG-L family deacetylase [Gemmatimonadota bacterium]